MRGTKTGWVLLGAFLISVLLLSFGVIGHAAKIAIVNPDSFRIQKFAALRGECNGILKYYSLAYGTVKDRPCEDITNHACWTGVGIQPDFIGSILASAGYTVDYYTSDTFPSFTKADYDLVVVQDPLTQYGQEYPKSVENSLPDLLGSVTSPVFIEHLKNYFASGGTVLLVGDAVRLLENPALGFGKIIVTKEAANTLSHPSDCVPHKWLFERGNPFCCHDRSASGVYTVENGVLPGAEPGVKLADLKIDDPCDLPEALTWSETLYYPSDGTSLLDVQVQGSGKYVLSGATCSPPEYTVTVQDVLSNFMGYTTYQGRKIYYLASDSYFDYLFRHHWPGSWHCPGKYMSMSYSTTPAGKSFIVELVKYALGQSSNVTPNAPTDLQAMAVSSTQINLSWQDNSNVETGFKIERRLPNTGFSQIAAVGTNITSFSDTGLKSNTTYCYRVKAYNATGNSGYSNEACATTSGQVSKVRLYLYAQEEQNLKAMNVNIQVNPLPSGSSGSVTTHWEGDYAVGTTVRLTAPQNVTWNDKEYTFVKWSTHDGAEQDFPQTSITLTLNEKTDATAWYKTKGAVILPVPYYHQYIGSNWCYLTSLAMLLRYYGVTAGDKPWKLASSGLFNLTYTKGLGPLSLSKLGDILKVKLGVNIEEKSHHIKAHLVSYLKEELSMGHPVLLGIGKPIGHAVVVIGFDADNFYINDPGGNLFKHINAWLGWEKYHYESLEARIAAPVSSDDMFNSIPWYLWWLPGEVRTVVITNKSLPKYLQWSLSPAESYGRPAFAAQESGVLTCYLNGKDHKYGYYWDWDNDSVGISVGKNQNVGEYVSTTAEMNLSDVVIATTIRDKKTVTLSLTIRDSDGNIVYPLNGNSCTNTVAFTGSQRIQESSFKLCSPVRFVNLPSGMYRIVYTLSDGTNILDTLSFRFMLAASEASNY